MKTNLTILTINKAQTRQGGTYWKIVTNQGNMSIWDKDVADVLNMNLNESISVEVTTSEDGKWRNIREFYGKAEITENMPTQKFNNGSNKISNTEYNKLMETNVVPKDVTPKEFHLSVEECRARALECVIKMNSDQPQGNKYSNTEFADLRKQIFAWIWAGKDKLTEEDSDIGSSPYD